MKNGQLRYLFFLQQVKELLIKAREQENPALWLFNNNARTPLFMLEGLAKLYAGMHNRKSFSKLKDQFKLIEDGLGQIDYYHWLLKTFIENKQIPSGCREFAEKQIVHCTSELNVVLIEKGWLSKKNRRIVKIIKKLDDIDWLKPKKEVEAISAFYKQSIENIEEFVADTKFHFDNVEEDVHELRRKLRWLSIYPQALQGLIQLAPVIETEPHLQKYLTEEIVNSPFNQLPFPGNNTRLLYLNANYFFALSWMIAELGNIKDEGLLLTGLCETLKQVNSMDEDVATSKAYQILGDKHLKMDMILERAEIITRTFFEEDNLKNLLTS